MSEPTAPVADVPADVFKKAEKIFIGKGSHSSTVRACTEAGAIENWNRRSDVAAEAPEAHA